MGAALGFGLLIPAIGRVSAATGPIGSVAAVFAADILFGLPLAAWRRVDLRPPPRRAILPVVLAGVFEIGGFVFIALAVGRAPLVVVAPLASLSSALTVLYAWIVLRDRPPPVAFAGAALACAGVVVLAL
jgi:drug/metabolite transporter (DMT)-like permease